MRRFIVVAPRGDGVVENAVGVAGLEIRGGGRGAGFPRGKILVGDAGHCRGGAGHCRGRGLGPARQSSETREGIETPALGGSGQCRGRGGHCRGRGDGFVHG